MKVSNRDILIFKIIISVVLSVFSSLVFAQSQFVIGYYEGYESTCCYYAVPSQCKLKVIPIAPIPLKWEKVSSYRDGYNRGIYDALNVFYENQNQQHLDGKVLPSKWQYIPDYHLLMGCEKAGCKYSANEFLENLKSGYFNSFHNRYFDARSHLEAAVEISHHSSEAMALLGFNAYKSGNYKISKYYLKKALKSDVDKKDDVKLILKSNKVLFSEEKSAARSNKRKESKGKSDGIYPDGRNSVELRAGAIRSNVSKDHYAFLAGIDFAISLNKKMSLMLDFEYFRHQVENKKALPYQESNEFELIQANMIFRNRLVNRLELIYGPGIAIETRELTSEFYYAVAGFQLFLSRKLFIDARLNYQFFREYSPMLLSPVNIKTSLGLRF